MPFYTYSLAPFLSTSPKTQILNELTSKLSEHWARTKEHVVLLSNVTLQGKLMDAVLVKQSAVCVFSFLDCGGRIEAQKTGMWKAGGKPIKGGNPYDQLDNQTKVIALELVKIKAVKEIQGIALFRNPIVFNDKASPIADKWFLVSDIESLSRKFFEKQGGLLKRPELETVLSKLGVDPELILKISAASSEATVLKSKPAAPDRSTVQLISKEEIDRILDSAQSHIDNTRYFTAVQDLEKVIKYDSSNHRALFLRGLGNYNLSQFNEAVQDYDRAIANGFTNDHVYFERALAHIKLGNETKALLDLGEAIKLNRHNRLYYQKRGEYLFSSGLYKLAIKDFNSHINLKGDDATPYFYRGCCYEKLEEYGEAKADLEMALRLSPNSHQAFKALLRVKKQFKKNENEIPADDLSHTIERTTATSLNLLPTLPKQAEDKPTNIQSRLKTPEEQALLLYHKGLENQQKALHFEALTDYNKAISLDSTNPVLYNQRGLCWLEVENEDRALADFSRALSLAPDYSEAGQHIEKINSSRAQQEYMKAIGLEKAGDYQGAIACYDKAIELALNKKAYYYKRGNAKRATGDLHGALHDFDTAIKLDSLFAKAYNDRGNIWQKLGNLEKAVNDYKQAVQLEPGFTIASNNLKYGMFLLEG